MHLSDAFIQSDIQAIHFFCQYVTYDWFCAPRSQILIKGLVILFMIFISLCLYIVS